MKIKFEAPIILIGMTLITAGLSGYSSYSANLRMIDSAKQRELKTTATVIQNAMQEQSNIAASRVALIVNLPVVQEAFRKRNRDEMIRQLEETFKVQKQQYGGHDAHFHLAPAFSYLRMYAHDSGINEDMSGFREMILTTNRTHEPQKGIEISRSGLNIRGIAPVADAQGPIGSFEIGLSFTTVLESVKKTTGFEAGVFIDDNLMKNVALKAARPDPERIIAGFQNVESTSWRELKPLLSPELLSTARDVTVKLLSHEGVEYGEVVVPVADFKGKPIGSVVAARNFGDFQTQAHWALVNAIGLALLQAVVLAATMMILFNARLLKPMATINASIERLLRSESSPDLTPLTQKDNEVGQIAKNLHSLEKAYLERHRAVGEHKEGHANG